MSDENGILLLVILLCLAWIGSILYVSRPRRHYWLDPEPPLTQRRCPLCDRTIFYAKTMENKTLILDASVPIYVQVKPTDSDMTRVCQVAAYIEHTALCSANPHLPSTAFGKGTRNGKANYDA